MSSIPVRGVRSPWRMVCALSVAACIGLAERSAAAADAHAEAPLVVGHRTVHVFRAPLGAFTAAERAESARARIGQAFERRGEGWTSIKPTPLGIDVELDGRSLFSVVPGDVRAERGETLDGLANAASRELQTAWKESQETRDSSVPIKSVVKVGGAILVLLFGLFLITKAFGRLRRFTYRHLHRLLSAWPAARRGGNLPELLPSLAARFVVLTAWLTGLAASFLCITYSMAQFALTRPAGEQLAASISALAVQGLAATAQSIPGVFVAIAIFLIAWLTTRVSNALFASAELGGLEGGLLDPHTAPASRRIVNAAVWLFAVAMAYPYLPGSQTEAFRGLSVIIGVMVSIGASGVVGQMASGLMIVYTYSLKKGEYVRIEGHEGTVTELGLFVTRLRTGLGEEISLPNTFVLANVTRNYSRSGGGRSYVLDVNVSIGYDTPWRQVHAMLVEATRTIPEILATPAPSVVQDALSDFYVAYRLVVHVDAARPATRARIASDLHAAIQDVFNRHGVQIMSPHYEQDPASPKIAAAPVASS